MITVQEATRIILENTQTWGAEAVPLHAATGRVLRENLVADRDFPPFDRVAMDGIAIQFEVFEKGQRTFPVEGLQAAGAPPLVLQNPQHCLEAMTGAVLPHLADSVVRYEDVLLAEGQATVTIETVQRGQHWSQWLRWLLRFLFCRSTASA